MFSFNKYNFFFILAAGCCLKILLLPQEIMALPELGGSAVPSSPGRTPMSVRLLVLVFVYTPSL